MSMVWYCCCPQLWRQRLTPGHCALSGEVGFILEKWSIIFMLLVSAGHKHLFSVVKMTRGDGAGAGKPLAIMSLQFSFLNSDAAAMKSQWFPHLHDQDKVPILSKTSYFIYCIYPGCWGRWASGKRQTFRTAMGCQSYHNPLTTGH